jgi:hypothetical protein
MPKNYPQSHNFRIRNRRLFCRTQTMAHIYQCILMFLGTRITIMRAILEAYFRLP